MMRIRRPSLLLLDLSMPKVNGMQILKIMRDDTELRHVPAIVLTSTRKASDYGGPIDGSEASRQARRLALHRRKLDEQCQQPAPRGRHALPAGSR